MKLNIYRLFFLLFFISNLYSEEKIILQLKWFHQFQFAGYYAAKEKGFYKENGLDVQIKQRDLRFNNIEQVINGEAQYGIADSILTLYKAKKEPVVIVSPIFQHSPSVLITLKSSGINSPYDLDGKDLIFYPNDTDGFSLLAMLKKINVKPNFIRKREKNDYNKLIEKQVDGSSAYLSNELFHFKNQNIDVNIINPSNYGFDLYGDMLFTNENEALYHPNRVQKFKEATLKGWEYALSNKEEIAQLIHDKYNTSKSIKHLLYEANVIEKLIERDITPLGSIDKGRIKYISSLYNDYGLSDKSFDINNFIFEEYIKNYTKINLTKEEKEYLAKNPILKVQNLISLPPYNFYEDGKPLGYTVDYMKIMANLLGIKVDFVSGKTWKEYLDMLKNGDLDIIPQIAINEERKKFIDYTNFKHIDFRISLGIRKESDIKSFKDLQNKTIAVLNKSFLHTILKNKYPNQKLYLAPTTKDAVEAVANGRADAIIDNLATIEYYISHNWLSNLKTITLNNVDYIPNKASLHMGVSKGNLVLKSILEKVYEVIPHSEVVSLKEKWLSLNNNNKIKWSNSEIVYLKKKKELVMCVDPKWMPFESIKDGQHIGMTADYIKFFQSKLPIDIKLKNTSTWLETLSFAQNRECDFVTIMMKTKSREKYFNFTQNLMQMPLVIATKQDKPFINDIRDVSSKKLGISEGYAYKELLENKYPNLNIVEVKNSFDGLLKVNENEIYGYIDVLPILGYNIQEHFVGNLKIAGKLQDNAGFSMATRNDEILLNDIFNKLIESITEDKNKEILNKWLSIKYEENIDYKTILYVILVFSIILFIIISKNRAINKINEKLSNYIHIVDENILTSETDLDGNIVEASKAFCEISGYTKEELIGMNHNIVRHEDMSDELFKDLWTTISAGKTWRGEIKNKKKDGKFYWVNAIISPIFDKRKNIIGYNSIRNDITDKKKVEEISITDELTTLYNKRYFNEVFENELNRAKRENKSFGLIILDIDFFKQYNDNYGHQKGDDVLEAVGKELKLICQRASDIVFRIGGEEFAIIFTLHEEKDAQELAKLVNRRIESLGIEHKYSKVSDYITVSIGVYNETGKTLHTTKDIYNFADVALYKAKESGRNQFKLYSEEV